MEYKVSAFKVIINGVKAYSWIITQGLLPLIYIWPIGIGYASYWIIRKSRILPGISWLNFIIKSVLRSRSWVVTWNIINV